VPRRRCDSTLASSGGALAGLEVAPLHYVGGVSGRLAEESSGQRAHVPGPRGANCHRSPRRAKGVPTGARGWAAYTPNVLNVMVSRAKQNFYVIGSHAAWAPVGHFRDLARSVHADSGLKRGRSSDGNSIPSPRTNAACANCALSH